MLGTVLFLVLLALALCASYFTKTTKNMPKTWYEWKTELRYQYIGITGLIHDFVNRRHDRVSLFKQPGRVAVITGGNRGIGLRTVEKLLACDMTVIMGVRDPQSAENAVGSIVDLSKIKGKLICEELDIGDLTSVKNFANKIKSKFDKVDILINNAGIMFAPFKISADGFESHFATNYLGHFLLTHLLMPQLKAAGHVGRNSRIVNVSSCANLIGSIKYKDINGRQNYLPGTSYSQSKLAQVLATRHTQRLLTAQGIPVQVSALHPGIVDTDLFEYSATTSVPLAKKIFFKTPEQGARTVVFAAIDPSQEGQGGNYLSNCRRGPINPVALNEKKCEEFFNFSCDLLGIKHTDYGNGLI